MLQPKKKSFNQIKIHSQYSICEGALKIESLKEYCKKNKIQSVGLSDTYNLSGALEFSENISSLPHVASTSTFVSMESVKD